MFDALTGEYVERSKNMLLELRKPPNHPMWGVMPVQSVKPIPPVKPV